jgi:hypothetical protein
MPTYFFFPSRLVLPITKLQLEFLKRRIGEEFTFQFVSSFKFCFPISKKRLGVYNFILFNRTLWGEWLWLYVHEREAFQRVIVDSKYGSSWDGWYSNEVYRLYRVWL